MPAESPLRANEANSIWHAAVPAFFSSSFPEQRLSLIPTPHPLFVFAPRPPSSAFFSPHVLVFGLASPRRGDWGRERDRVESMEVELCKCDNNRTSIRKKVKFQGYGRLLENGGRRRSSPASFLRKLKEPMMGKGHARERRRPFERNLNFPAPDSVVRN